ncbi:MAG: hypothetical protein [Bacteriophage sp.]|nr:MAG: hypothetical protein [Bacteriophage sp.]
MTIIKRADLGRPLTWDELDDNFQQVDNLTAAAAAAVSSASASATAAAGSATASANSAINASSFAADASASATVAINALMNSTFEPSDFDFASGGTLDSTDRNKAVFNPADNNWYSWTGTLSHVVVAGTDPTADSNWKPRTDQLLRQELASTTLPGSSLLGSDLNVNLSKAIIQVDTINDLKNLTPHYSARVYTKGAFSVNDGGADSWVFLLTDQSENVTTYPRLFIPPATDPSGASGAWFINTGKALNAVSFGLGCTADVTINDAIVNQLIAYNKGKNDIILPAKTIFSKQVAGEYSPNFKGVKGATANETGGNGTVFIFKNADSADSCMKFQRASGFITGFFMEGFTLVGYDAFNGVTIDTFGPRTNRKGLDLKYIGGKIKIDEIFIIGISEALHVDRLQDGKLSGVRMLYCSDADGTVPAAWISTSDGTNTNFMHFENMHVEFSPFMLFLGYSRHNKFDHCKFESQRKVDATHYSVHIDASAFENAFDSTMFVTTANTLQHYMFDRGTNTTIRDSWFDSTAITVDMAYPGIRWYYGNTVTSNPNGVIDNCKFSRVLPADGSDPLAYPIVLGNYQKFSGRINVDTTVTYAGGTLNIINSGLISLGNNNSVDNVTFAPNTNPKTAGPVFYYRGTEANIVNVNKIQGDLIYSLTGGNANNAIRMYGPRSLISTSSTPDVTGKESVILSAATNVTRFNGEVGQIVTIVSTASGSTLTFDANYLITSTGANISMVANKAYQFMMISNTKATQVGS